MTAVTMEKSSTMPAATMAPSDKMEPASVLYHRWTTGHIRVLDGLRACAVLSVMFYHFLGADDPAQHPLTGLVGGIQKIFSVGWCGVDLFFILSGFLITGILLDAKPSSKTYFRSFYIRRVLRIFPLYYGVILFVAIAKNYAPLSHYFGFEDVRASLWWMAAYLSNFVMALRHSKVIFGPMGHFWSLAVEEHFYLAWPALVWLCTRRQLAIACGAFIAGAFILRCGLSFHDPLTYSPYLLSPCRVDGLALGALLAMVVRSGLNVDRLRKWAWILAGISLAMILVLGFRGEITRGHSHTPDGGFSHYGRAMETGGFSLFAVFFASVVVLAISSRAGSPGRRILEWGPLISIGRYSFAMYVLHLFCLRAFTHPWAGFYTIDWLERSLHSHNLAWLFFAILSAGATYCLAWLSWHLYEQHFLKLKRLFPY